MNSIKEAFEVLRKCLFPSSNIAGALLYIAEQVVNDLHTLAARQPKQINRESV